MCRILNFEFPPPQKKNRIKDENFVLFYGTPYIYIFSTPFSVPQSSCLRQAETSNLRYSFMARPLTI